MAEDKWYRDGIRFECQGSGNCCTSRGEYGYVYLTLQDRRRFAEYFKIPTHAFTRKYCEKSDGIWHLKEDPKRPDCMFLKDKRCSVYPARPTQCRTWPFWPEALNAKVWRDDISVNCPGVGKGRIVPFEEVERQMAEQVQSESEYGT